MLSMPAVLASRLASSLRHTAVSALSFSRLAFALVNTKKYEQTSSPIMAETRISSRMPNFMVLRSRFHCVLSEYLLFDLDGGGLGLLLVGRGDFGAGVQRRFKLELAKLLTLL